MTYHARFGEGHEIVLPSELADEMGFGPGDTLVVERDGATLTIKPHSQIVRETQQRFREMVGDYKGSMVDELIADRRAEAAREDAEHEEWARARGL